MAEVVVAAAVTQAVAGVTQAVAGVVQTVFQSKGTTGDPVKKLLEDSNNLDEIYGILIREKEKLHARRLDCQNSVDTFKWTKMTSKSYDNWVCRVLKIEDRVEKLSREYVKKSSQFLGALRHPDLSKKMKRASREVINYMEESYKLGDILIDKGPGGVVKTITPDIKDILTLQERLEEILDLLSNSDVRGIRIHGQFGSGKTTIMQNLNNHDKVDEMFDIVIWVTVSREGSKENLGLHHLQQDIAKRLNFDAESVGHPDQVAFHISNELQKRKYLLLLDDVKEDLNFHQIGIPVGNKGSKIVFTTRLQVVCYPIADRNINVPKLKEKEALKMFKNILGRPDLEAIPHIKRLMPSVVQWCDYLPLIIKVAAGAFRVKETEDSWLYAISKLVTWPEKGDDSMSEMFKLLKSCYGYLEGSGRSFFFYSALYPVDSPIEKDCLLDNWVADNFLGSDDVAQQNSRGSGRDMLEYLTKVLLLEESVCKNYITMHKLIRLAALHSLSTDDEGKYLVKPGGTLQECPNMEEWSQKRWISLVDSKLGTLPIKPDSTMLSTLFLQNNPNLKMIPVAFFECMGNLRVLDLHSTGITTLPLSLLNLVNLKALYLNSCTQLIELPYFIRKLHQLEVLDIRGSGLRNIPIHIQDLVRLRRFLASSTMLGLRDGSLNLVLNCQIISKIPTLKELIIDVKELDMLLMIDMITNIEPLAKLSTFQFCCQSWIIDVIKMVGNTSRIYFPREDVLRSYVGRKDFNFSSFQFFIGCQMSTLPQIPKFRQYLKYIRYCDGEVNYRAISQVLCHADAFELVTHNELEHLSEFTGSMNKVRGCLIESCSQIRTIVDVNHGNSILQNLERLYLKNLPTLSSLWEASLLLPRLMTLALSNCPMMIGVCPYVVIQELPELQHLEVNNCCGIQELITASANIGPTVFPKLRKLVLLDMPQLKCVLANDSFVWPSLEKLKIQRCPRLLRIPFTKQGALNLSSIITEELWWEALENPQDVKDHLRTFCIFNKKARSS